MQRREEREAERLGHSVARVLAKLFGGS